MAAIYAINHRLFFPNDGGWPNSIRMLYGFWGSAAGEIGSEESTLWLTIAHDVPVYWIDGHVAVRADTVSEYEKCCRWSRTSSCHAVAYQTPIDPFFYDKVIGNRRPSQKGEGRIFAETVCRACVGPLSTDQFVVYEVPFWEEIKTRFADSYMFDVAAIVSPGFANPVYMDQPVSPSAIEQLGGYVNFLLYISGDLYQWFEPLLKHDIYRALKVR
jgi:hypothetical protein